MKAISTLLLTLSALAASTVAYTNLEARYAYDMDDFSQLEARDAAPYFHEDEVHLLVRDAYLAGQEDGYQALVARTSSKDQSDRNYLQVPPVNIQRLATRPGGQNSGKKVTWADLPVKDTSNPPKAYVRKNYKRWIDEDELF
ncbi:MAG: hypothetical protein LQ340_007481 [Diploschistes diacapsis]|nr:MAG: hypothetical protein LQ340_007481 [Diploschistes diacapsis]